LKGESITVYGYNISTRYSEVYWTMQPPIALPADFVARFAGKVVAVTGYVGALRCRAPTAIGHFNPLFFAQENDCFSRFNRTRATSSGIG
jgi:hypothetical protein